MEYFCFCQFPEVWGCFQQFTFNCPSSLHTNFHFFHKTLTLFTKFQPETQKKSPFCTIFFPNPFIFLSEMLFILIWKMVIEVTKKKWWFVWLCCIDLLKNPSLKISFLSYLYFFLCWLQIHVLPCSLNNCCCWFIFFTYPSNSWMENKCVFLSCRAFKIHHYPQGLRVLL